MLKRNLDRLLLALTIAARFAVVGAPVLLGYSFKEDGDLSLEHFLTFLTWVGTSAGMLLVIPYILYQQRLRTQRDMATYMVHLVAKQVAANQVQAISKD